jgi:putative sigma-54 modulation protein
MAERAKFIEEEAMGYRINIIGRNIYVTEAMKNHAWDKLSKIDRFHNHVMDIHVTMDIQKLEHSVVIILKFDHLKIKVSASSTDMYASIDKAVDKLQAQLRRWKGKIQDHHRKSLSIVDMQVNVLKRPYHDVNEFNAEIENENIKKEVDEYRLPHVVGTETKPLKTLTTDEAIMKLDLSGDGFLIFRGEEDRKLKVLYRRNDGHFGMILPE